MTLVWNKVIPFSKNIINLLDKYSKIENNYHIKNDNFIWENYLYTDKSFRRAHIEIVDARAYKKIWVMHMTIFPYFDDASPLFGFDVVCGANKITGAFHDFSKMGESNMYNYFQETMQLYNWNKPRELPDWARQIFSPAMLAVGNISNEQEIDQLLDISIDNLQYYLYHIGNERSNKSHKEQYNKYCKFQKMNPHTPAMMASIGVEEKLFRTFMDDTLFPEQK